VVVGSLVHSETSRLWELVSDGSWVTCLVSNEGLHESCIGRVEASAQRCAQKVREYVACGMGTCASLEIPIQA